MSTGGIEISFLQVSAAITGIACNRKNHTAQVWIDGDAVLLLINSRSAIKRLVNLICKFDDDTNIIVIFDTSNTYLGKLVADAADSWKLVRGPALQQINAKAERKRDLWEAWKLAEHGKGPETGQGTSAGALDRAELGAAPVDAS